MPGEDVADGLGASARSATLAVALPEQLIAETLARLLGTQGLHVVGWYCALNAVLEKLRRCRVLTGTVSGIDHARKVARVVPVEGPEQEIAYDVVVVAPGSVVRTLPIPGLAEQGIGFKSVAEAIYLRNHVLSRLDYAASVTDEARRRKALTFVFIGGGYAGTEAFAELEDMARYATRYYPDLTPGDMRWVLVEAAGRILPEVSVPNRLGMV
jgi:NADH dehydrogenase